MTNQQHTFEMMDKTLKWFSMELDELIPGDPNMHYNVLEPEIFLGIILYYPELREDKYYFINLKLILDELVQDKYLTSVDIGQGAMGYTVTLKGKLFSANRGYKGRNDREVEAGSLLLSQTKSQRAMKVLTRWIAVGTIVAGVYYLIQILKEMNLWGT